jgi:hypothetical protein
MHLLSAVTSKRKYSATFEITKTGQKSSMEVDNESKDIDFTPDAPSKCQKDLNEKKR